MEELREKAMQAMTEDGITADDMPDHEEEYMEKVVPPLIKIGKLA